MRAEQRRVFVFFYFLSGAVSLLYEILWVRLFEVVIGSSILSVACILTSFMGGLALGSYIFGRLAQLTQRPLYFYGLLELGIGLYALFVPKLQQLFLIITPASMLAKYAITFLILLPPTLLMGGTYPAIVQFFLHQREKRGLWTGLLYGVNTLGAAIGALATGFYLIYGIGIRMTNLAAVAINLFIGITAIFISRKSPAFPASEGKKAEKKSIKHYKWGVACLFISGMTTLLYELVWTRLLTLILGSSTYAFTVVLVTFLLGLSLGSSLLSPWIDKIKNTVLIASTIQILLCLFIFFSLPLQDRLPLLFFDLYKQAGSSFWKIEILQFFICAITLIVPTMLIGSSFPCFMRIALDDIQDWKSHIGPLYAVNSAGNMLGSILGSLIILPFLGMEKSIELGILIHLVMGTGLLLSSSLRKDIKFPVFFLCVVFGLTLTQIPAWNLNILTSGLSVYAPKYSSLKIDQKRLVEELNRSKILYSKDGWTSHVTVRKYGGVMSLLVNGKADGSDGEDIQTELLSAHLPLLLHSNAKNIFVIGLGTGITLRAALAHPVESILCAEIEKRIEEASHFFKKAHDDCLKDPRLQWVIDDARHALASSDKKFDVIISEPSNPWLSGIGSLYTTEMFRQMEKHLNEGGIVCQWIHYYNMSEEDLKTVVRTFQNVFPQTSMWAQAHLSDLFLIGVRGDSLAHLKILKERFNIPSVKKDLLSIHLNRWSNLQALLWLNPSELRAYAGNGVLNTDNHPILEFSAPRSLYLDTMAGNLKGILSYRLARQNKFEQSMTHFLQAMICFYEKNVEAYLDELVKAIKLNPHWSLLSRYFEEAIYQESQFLYQKGKENEAEALLLKASPHVPKSYRINYSIGYFLQQTHHWSKARAYYLKAIRANPKLAQAHNNLGVVYLNLQKIDKAYESFKKALELDPFYLEAHFNLANCLLQQKAFEGAELEYQICLKINPRLSAAYNGLGAVYAMQKKYRDALPQFKKALELEPQNQDALRNLEKVVSDLNRNDSGS